MKYLLTLFFCIALVWCNNNSSFIWDVENPDTGQIESTYNSETKQLDLSNAWFSWELDLNTLMGTWITSEVTYINLSGNQLDSIILPSLPNLMYLDLSDNKLDDEDIVNLPEIKLNKTYLDVSWNNITQTLLEALEAKMTEYHPDIK